VPKKGHQFHQLKNQISMVVKMETIKIKIKEVAAAEIDKWNVFK
jgi:ribosomal protein S3